MHHARHANHHQQNALLALMAISLMEFHAVQDALVIAHHAKVPLHYARLAQLDMF